MKNTFIILIMLLGLFTFGCDPMGDIYDEIDAEMAKEYVVDTFNLARETAPDAYTLTDADYELSSNPDVAKYKNFSDYALPKDYLPEILNQKFTAPDAFEMLVTYNYYSKPVVDSANAYEISSGEYDEMGQSYSNFTDEAEAEALIAKLLDRKVYETEAGTEKTVLYTLYSTNDTRYIRVNADNTTEVLSYSSDAYELDSTDYEDLGQGTYYNFYKISNAESGVVDLAALRGHTLPKDYSCEVYLNYYDTYVVYYFDGANWQVKNSVMAVTEPLNYALNSEDITKSTWWADPAIKITLTSDDYNLYPETSNYQNFDLRSGKVPGTDRAKLVEMIGGMLDANHNPVEDQQYLVNYAYYDGSNGTTNIRVIKTAGVWSEYSE